MRRCCRALAAVSLCNHITLLHGMPADTRGSALLRSREAGPCTTTSRMCLRGGREPPRTTQLLHRKDGRARTQPKSTGDGLSPVAAGMAAGDGHLGAASVALYLLTSLTLTLMNKFIFSEFQYPLFVTEFQLLVSLVLLVFFGEVSRWTGLLSVVPPLSLEWSKMLTIAPVTLLFVSMLSMTNYCLRHVDIGFYQVLRSTVIPFNIVLSYMLLGILPSAYASVCCVVVASGFILGSLTELNFSREGFGYGITSAILVALYSSSVKKVLPAVGNNTWQLMHYTTVQGIVLLVPAVYLTGEWQHALTSPELHSRNFWIFMTEAAVAGFMINLAYFGLIKFGSPLTTHIAGSTKTALQTLIGIALFSNKVTPLNAAGIALTLLGSTLYSMERYLSPWWTESWARRKTVREEADARKRAGVMKPRPLLSRLQESWYTALLGMKRSTSFGGLQFGKPHP